MTRPDGPATTHAAFASFVDGLLTRSDRARVVTALDRGHEAGGDGWCRHPVHDLTGQPEQHPCTTSRLVAAIRRSIRELTEGGAAEGRRSRVRRGGAGDARRVR